MPQTRRSAVAQLGGAAELLHADLDVEGRDEGDAVEAFGVGGAEVAEPVVVGPKARRLEVAVGDAVDARSHAGIEHLGLDPVHVHVYDADGGVVAAAASLLGLLLLGGVGGAEGADRTLRAALADEEVAAAVGALLDARRSLPKLGVDALGPHPPRL